jgi:hypothetical protein
MVARQLALGISVAVASLLLTSATTPGCASWVGIASGNAIMPANAAMAWVTEV